MRISDWSSDVCSSDLLARMRGFAGRTELYADRVRMVRDGMAAAVAEFLGSFRAEAETVVRLDRINALEISRPVFLPPLLVLHYARSEERRVGNERGSTCRSRVSPSH